MKSTGGALSEEQANGKGNEKLDFQTIRPPNLGIGVIVMLLPVLIVAISLTLAMINYSWIPVKAGFIAIMASTVVICGLNFLLITGRPKVLHMIQILVLLYAVVPVSLVFTGEISWLVFTPILISMLFMYLTFSIKLWEFLYFFKVMWDRHRERNAKSD